MKYVRSSEVILSSQPCRAKRKADRSQLGREDTIKKDLRELGTSWESLKNETLNILGLRRSVRSCVGHGQLGAVVSC